MTRRAGPLLKTSGHAWQQRRLQVLARDHNQCQTCGSTENLEIDHIIERRFGGGDELTNLITRCHSCHVRKTNATSSSTRRKPRTAADPCSSCILRQRLEAILDLLEEYDGQQVTVEAIEDGLTARGLL